jgi:hypothetical protein
VLPIAGALFILMDLPVMLERRTAARAA